MSFKSLDLSRDVASLVSSINEVVAISSSLFAVDANVKFFKNIASASAGTDLGGYWETAYDSSPTSSLSTPLLDFTFGYATGSTFNVSVAASSSQNEKIKIYREMASMLLGNPDSLFNFAGADQSECFFIMVKRGLQKDEIKKGAMNILLKTTSSIVTASDDGAVTAFKQTLGGDYAPLKVTGSEVGQVWYQAGVIVLDPQLIWGNPANATYIWSGSKGPYNLMYSGSINDLINGLRTHVDAVNFHNQTNLYSTIFFCRATNTDFNYSSNPTFVDANKRIRVTSGSNILQSRTYVTTVGLYDANDNLLAVAKVNKPITKSPDTEATFRVRLDY